jgi:DNA/RNA endonuclease G (NUC1)
MPEMNAVRTSILAAFVLLLPLAAIGADANHPRKGAVRNLISSITEDGEWRALDWDEDVWGGFEGAPQLRKERPGLHLVRRKRFVANYDVSLLCPLWVAHIDTRESAANSLKRPDSDPKWKRPAFRSDPLLMLLWKKAKLVFTRDRDFLDLGYARGHMASNAEMKGFDRQAQIESFYLSNIVPQLQGHNGGIWAKLEADCLNWAKRFETIYVVTGPVFSNGKRIRWVKGRGLKLSIPDHFFKVIYAESDDGPIAAAFLVPHRDDLRKDNLFDFQVSVDAVEKSTGLNFMPELGEPNPLEKRVDLVWRDVQ